MNIRDLKYLIAVANFKHFGKAANACFVSQPTLSAQLKKLEEELNVQLFERDNKRVLITPIGHVIVQQAKNVLSEVEQLENLAHHSQDPLSGKFRLGIIPTCGPYLLPLILPGICKKLPNLELIIHEDKTETILASLNSGDLDAIILALPVQSDGLHVIKLYDEDFFVALPKSHPLTKKTSLTNKDLKNENLLLLGEGHCLRDQTLDVCQYTYGHNHSEFQATSLETLQHMVAINLGITLLPKLTVDKFKVNKALVIKPFKAPTPKRKIGLLYRKHSAVELSANEIVKIIKSTVK